MTSIAPPPASPLPSFADALEPWCAAGVTGALRLPGRAGGAVYLVDGDLTYAESRYASGLTRLLPASGRLTAAAVRAAAVRGEPPMATRLTAPGLLSPEELEAAVTAALYGAAYFLFDTRAAVRLEVGVRHPIGALVRAGFATVRAEVDRRRRELYQAFPDAALDLTPVTAVRNLPAGGVSLTPLQWEIVVSAVRHRTPVDLARALGRDTYQVLLAVRQMVADGLLRPEQPAPTAAAAADGRRNTATRPPRKPAKAAKATPAARGNRRRAKPEPAATPLPRRGDAMSFPPPLDGFGTDEETTDSMLLRIRDALRALA
ncbi:MAG TPA: hypothetical protein VKB69_08200 [Micromonosporaceae bacterium]|nr:hypothetical protein [Micromonosporaceae bacterium]